MRHHNTDIMVTKFYTAQQRLHRPRTHPLTRWSVHTAHYNRKLKANVTAAKHSMPHSDKDITVSSHFS